MQVVMPPEGAFAHAPKLQHVPILIGDDGSYPIEANRYLDERSNGEWQLPRDRSKAKAESELFYGPIPTLRSRRKMAARLSIFLEWCIDQATDWREISYNENILHQYQPALLSGDGSPSGRQLDPATVNLYVNEACLFLTWASERGYRLPMQIPVRKVAYTYISPTSSQSGTLRSKTVRIGSLTAPEAPIILPPDREVEMWLKSISVRAPVKILIFELIIRSGLRISEANQLRVTCFPAKRTSERTNWQPDWILAGEVPLVLKYGTKGGKVSPGSDLGTRWRTVFVPLDLAERIWHYISVIRPTQLTRYHIGDRKHTKRTDRLWLGEGVNRPVSNEMLRRIWTSDRHCPKGWHPHTGRHHFAVEKICALTRAQLALAGNSELSGADFGWLHGLMAGQVKMLLSPLMGHVDERTTMQYLRAAVAKIGRDRGHPAIRWNAIIDEALT